MTLAGACARRAGWVCSAAVALVALLPVAAQAQALGQLSGYVYVDRNNDGHLAFSDQARPELVMSGVEVKLFNLSVSATNPIATTVTDAIGQYLFPGLSAGTYRIAQTQPTGYLDGRDTLGMMRDASNVLLTNGLGTVEADAFTNIVLPAGGRGGMYDFGERGLLPGFVSKRYLLGTAPPPVVAPPDPILNNNAVPEPTGLALAATAGGLTLGAVRRRRVAG